VREIAELMYAKSRSELLVTSESGLSLGIVTDRDLRERVLSKGTDTSVPVYEVMTSPLMFISDRSPVYEAYFLMHENDINHLAVKNSSGDISGLIKNYDLFRGFQHPSSFLLRDVNSAADLDGIVSAHRKLPLTIKTMIDSGANARDIMRIITVISDTIVDKLIHLALEKMGPPPASFAFMALGSEGREEQTLLTDQDNALIYRDVPEDYRGAAEKYFLEFSDTVCGWLDTAGYNFCLGDAMAKNPKWCQPESVWKKYFQDWITKADPQDLFDVNIFFDFRCVYGDLELTDDLRRFINRTSRGKAAFFYHLAQNSLFYKPPINILGGIVVGSKGDHSDSFSIKDAVKPIQNFARVYSLQNSISEINTLKRLKRMNEMKIINGVMYDEIVQAYNFLMLMRFKHQASQIHNNIEPDNYINPRALTEIERTMLKKIFSKIVNFQSKMSYDFTGTA